MTRKSARRRRLIAVLIALSPFLAGELLLRLRGFEYPRFEFPIQVWNAKRDAELTDETSLHRFDEDLFWVPREDALVPWTEDEHVSPGSFRGEDPDPSARLRILVLGDSSTFGWHVRDEETYARLLERELEGRLPAAPRSGRAVQVLNGGVVGFTARQGLARYRLVADTWRPDVVIAAFGTINEHFPTMDLDDEEKMDWLRRRRRPVHRLSRFLRDDVRLLHWCSWKLDERRGGRDAWLGEFAVAEKERRIGLQDYRELDDYKRRVSVEDFAGVLDALYEETRADGASLILIRMPRKRSIEQDLPPVLDYDPVVDALVERTGVPLVRARAAVRATIEAGRDEDELFWDGTHPKADGHRIVADTLIPVVRAELEARGLVPGR